MAPDKSKASIAVARAFATEQAKRGDDLVGKGGTTKQIEKAGNQFLKARF